MRCQRRVWDDLQNGSDVWCFWAGDGPFLGSRLPNQPYTWLSYKEVSREVRCDRRWPRADLTCRPCLLQVSSRAELLGSGLLSQGCQPNTDQFIGVFAQNRPEVKHPKTSTCQSQLTVGDSWTPRSSWLSVDHFWAGVLHVLNGGGAALRHSGTRRHPLHHQNRWRSLVYTPRGAMKGFKGGMRDRILGPLLPAECVFLLMFNKKLK